VGNENKINAPNRNSKIRKPIESALKIIAENPENQKDPENQGENAEVLIRRILVLGIG
jgi:hypothetical protein